MRKYINLNRVMAFFMTLILCLGLVPVEALVYTGNLDPPKMTAEEIATVTGLDAKEILTLDSPEVQNYMTETTISQAFTAEQYKQWEADSYAPIISSVGVSSGLGAGQKSSHCVKSGGEYLPMVIAVKDLSSRKIKLCWLYEITTGVGQQLTQGVLPEDPGGEVSAGDEYGLISGQLFYFPQMPSIELNKVTGYMPLSSLEVSASQIENVALRDYFLGLKPEEQVIPVVYNYQNLEALSFNGLYNAMDVFSEGHKGNSTLGLGTGNNGWIHWTELTAGDSTHTWSTDLIPDVYKFAYSNFKNRASPSIVTGWVSSVEDTRIAENHLGNFLHLQGDGGEDAWLAPRYVMNKFGNSVTYISFSNDVVGSEATLDKTTGLFKLYKNPTKFPGHDSKNYVDVGSVNLAWMDQDAARNDKAAFNSDKLTQVGDTGYFKEFTSPFYPDKTLLVLNRNNEEAKKILLLSAFMEDYFGWSYRREVYYANAPDLQSHAYKSDEDNPKERGIFKLIIDEKETFKSNPGKSVYASYYPGELTKESMSQMLEWSEETRNLYKDASLTWKFLYYMSIMEINFSSGDLKNGASPSEIGSGYCKVSMVNGNNYNSWNLGKVVYYHGKIDPQAINPISKDLVVGDAEEFKTGPTGDNADAKYFGTNLWDINDEGLAALGIDRKQWDKLKTGDKDNPNVKTLKNWNKDEWTKYMKLIDPVNDSLNADATYIIQSSVHMNLTYNNEPEEDINELYDKLKPYSYHDNIDLGYYYEYQNKDTCTGAAGDKVPVTLTTEGMHYPGASGAPDGKKTTLFNKPINLENKGKQLFSMQADNKFVQNGYGKYTSDDFLTNSAISPFSYDYKTAKDSFLPYLDENGLTVNNGVIDGYGNGNYLNNTKPSDPENKGTNIALFRQIYHVDTEEVLAKYKVVPEDEKAVVAITTHLYEEGANLSGSRKNRMDPIFSSEIKKEGTKKLEDVWLDMAFNLVMNKKDAVAAAIKADPELGKTTNDVEFLNGLIKYLPNGVTGNEEAALKGSVLIFLKGYTNPKIRAEVFGTDFAWMFHHLGTVNTNDNTDPKNDALTMFYKVGPKAQKQQRNLFVSFVTIYTKPIGSSEAAKSIYRSERGDVLDTKKKDGGVIDLVKQNIIFSTKNDYIICFASTFEAMKKLPGTMKTEDLESLNTDLYMYGFVSGGGGSKEDPKNMTHMDTAFGESYALKGHWHDKDAGVPESGDPQFSVSKTDSPFGTGTTSSDINAPNYNNRVLSGKYYGQILKDGKGEIDKNGRQYVEGMYYLGIHPDYQKNENDDLNDNTRLPPPYDVDDISIRFRFMDGQDFDNLITEIFLIDRNDEYLIASQDPNNPCPIKDISIGDYNGPAGQPGDANLLDNKYTLVVRVRRDQTLKDVKNIGSSCELSFTGKIGGDEIPNSAPRKMNLLTGSLKGLKDAPSNSSNNLQNNGDYITYYYPNIVLLSGTQISLDFVFKHRENDGSLSTNDLKMENNFKPGYWAWGPMDFVVKNLIVMPNNVNVDVKKGVNNDLVFNFSCQISANYKDPDGKYPEMYNEKLKTNFVLELENKIDTSPGSVFGNGREVFRMNDIILTVNGSDYTVDGEFKYGRRKQWNGGVLTEGSKIPIYKDNQYNLVARINGGNSPNQYTNTHERPNDQKVKIETVNDNNRQEALIYVETSDPNMPDPPPLCPSTCLIADSRTWTQTFNFTECPTSIHDSHTTCTDDGCVTIKDCHPTGCHSWTDQGTFFESYQIDGAYVKSTDTKMQWVSAASAVIRAGSDFHIAIKDTYYTDRNQEPPIPGPTPYGGDCDYLSRSPGFSYVPYRHMEVKVFNDAGGQDWTYNTYQSEWVTNLNNRNHISPMFRVPETTKNLTLRIEAETEMFWGYPEGKQVCFCDEKNFTTKITGPLPIAEGTNQIDNFKNEDLDNLYP